MNAEQQPGYWVGAVLGGTVAGAITGLLPLFLGVRRNANRVAVGGFLASVAGGAVAGIIGAAIPAGVVAGLILWRDQSAEGAPQTPPRRMNGGTALASYLVVMFFGQTVFLALFWSFFMSFWMGQSFVSILVPAGAAFGLTVGIFITVVMAVLVRAGIVRIPVLDREGFLAVLDRAAGKLRYRRVPGSDEPIVYEPRTLLRLEATHISVALLADEAVLTGPHQALNRLKKELEKAGAHPPGSS